MSQLRGSSGAALPVTAEPPPGSSHEGTSPRKGGLYSPVSQSDEAGLTSPGRKETV